MRGLLADEEDDDEQIGGASSLEMQQLKAMNEHYQALRMKHAYGQEHDHLINGLLDPYGDEDDYGDEEDDDEDEDGVEVDEEAAARMMMMMDEQERLFMQQ